MFKKRTILAVVPARGGSKGIKNKNIYPLCGRPLIAYTADVVKELPWIDRAVVSTDSEAIGAAAVHAGLEVPFYRPESISGDRIGDWDVLNHALCEMERLDGRTYDIVLMLQPTSPLRRPEHVTSTVERLVCGGYDSVWTLSPTDSKAHPLKQLIMKNDTMDFYDPAGKAIKARQELEPVYHRNGVAYAITRRCIMQLKSIWGEKSSAVILDDPVANIDTEQDILWAEFQMGCHGKVSPNAAGLAS